MNRHIDFTPMQDKPDTPKVGVGVILRKKREILLLQRRNAHGSGEWSLPGGHMELGECFDGVCKREVHEETGVPIHGVRQIGFTNDIFPKDGLHYVTLFFEAYWDPAIWTPKIMEPDKTSAMGWFDLKELPNPTFPPLRRLVERQFLTLEDHQ